MAYEEPAYEIVKRANGYEVRLYGERLAAEVEQKSGQDNAFGKLRRYISGANQSSEKVSMTVPVAQSEKIAMTVPVAQSIGGQAGTMQFFLPSKYTLETAPRPTSPAIKIVVVEEGHFAVHRYSGRASTRNFERESQRLLDRLKEDKVAAISEPIRATYNGPFTPPFLRRNEVMVRVSWPNS